MKLSLDEARNRLAGNEQLLREMITMFIEDAPPRLAKLAAADDASEARREAHSIKGHAATVGADDVILMAGQVEAAVQHEGCSALPSLLPALERTLDETLAALRRYLDS
ncbi:MAG: Hpt domain-containing protein [Planctomycetes bacterium]|nr:Hpt domain-containing protein [Planctomycetota bacterium]